MSEKKREVRKLATARTWTSHQ